MSANPVRRFFDFLAKMGLSVRDDPPKTVDLALREWGPESGGLALSIAPVATDDPGSVPALSLVLRNVASSAVVLGIPPWIFFYRVGVNGRDGSPVPLTPYGRELLKAERNTGARRITLEPNGIAETQLPWGAIYSARPYNSYEINVSCCPVEADKELKSNRLII